MDPEPGRCRRTDGKKWRCSRDVVAGQKYCERVHRGRNRSRKPVESPTSTVTAVSTVGGGDDDGVNAASGDGLGGSASTPKATSSGDHCSLAGAAPPRDMFQLNQGLPESKTNKKSFFKSWNDASGEDNAHNNRVLRSFIDDWRRSSDHTEDNSATSLISFSISTLRNPSSDFLKLSTGSNVHEPEGHPQVNWWGGSSNHANSLGGPLVEALRSSTGSSPTSVLHQLQRSSASDTSFVST